MRDSAGPRRAGGSRSRRILQQPGRQDAGKGRSIAAVVPVARAALVTGLPGRWSGSCDRSSVTEGAAGNEGLMRAVGRWQVAGMEAAPAPRLQWLLVLIGTVAALAMVTWQVGVLAEANMLYVDWLTYSRAFERLAAGDPIYAGAQLGGPYHMTDTTRIGYSYPPASLPLLAPFAAFPVGLGVWFVLNVGVFLTGLWAVARRELGPWALGGFGLALLCLGILTAWGEGVAGGNINVALAGILAWAWVIGRGRVGAIAGVLAVAKILPGSLAFWARPSTLARSLTEAAAAALLICVLTLPVVGFDAWSDFFRALGNAEPACAYPVPSVACAVAPAIGMGSAMLLSIAIGIALALAAVLVRDDYYSFCLVTFAWLAPTADLHVHSWLTVFVLAFVGVSRFAGRRRRPADSVVSVSPGGVVADSMS